MVLVKDWMQEAANEIADTVRYGDGNEEEFRAAIERHCPLKDGVLYIEQPRCGTCKHWEPRGIRVYCTHPALRLHASLLFKPQMETTKDFGCVQWEQKS